MLYLLLTTLSFALPSPQPLLSPSFALCAFPSSLSSPSGLATLPEPPFLHFLSFFPPISIIPFPLLSLQSRVYLITSFSSCIRPHSDAPLICQHCCKTEFIKMEKCPAQILVSNHLYRFFLINYFQIYFLVSKHLRLMPFSVCNADVECHPFYPFCWYNGGRFNLL